MSSNPFANEALSSPELRKKRYEAAVEFLRAFEERMPLVEGKLHAGTILAVAARLSGSSLYRALNGEKDVTPGVVVLSAEVDQAWPSLMNLFVANCKQKGVDVTDRPMVTQFPETDQPLMTVDQVLQEYQDQYHAVMKKHGLDYLNGAWAGMIVCSIIFDYHQKSNDIDPYVAAGIVAMGVVEGAKTAPPPLGAPRTGTKKMSRLVLGEPEAARAEARATGAIYIDLNPEAEKLLRQKQIDPYLIYEQGLRKQMEEKIARIDFVKLNVEVLFEEWRSQPPSQAPIPVRLILWLKNNARTYGYEQMGNSWVLK